jgi:uncharacterized protein
MTLRVGFDLDGVLADFGSAFADVERELFGADTPVGPASTPEEEAEQKPDAKTPSAKEIDRRHQAVWRRIRATADFWTTLKPLDPDAVRRLHALMLQHRWEVVFITQRPPTAGDTVQRQTQRWLVRQGFDLPSVLVIAGSRGAAANALRLNYFADDSARNCVDVRSDSTAMPILIGAGESAVRQARQLGMGVAGSIGECLRLLEGVSRGSAAPSVVQRIAALVGFAS